MTLSMNQKIRYFIKLSAAWLLYMSGFLFMYQRFKLRGKSIVLMYHRVLTQSEMQRTNSARGIIVLDSTFDKQIRFLKKRFNIVTSSQLNSALTHQQTHKTAAVLISFDDGWIDNYKNAFPVLQKYTIPALIFLSTDFISTSKVFWQEKCRLLIKLFANQLAQNSPNSNGNNHDLARIGLTEKNISGAPQDELLELSLGFLKNLDEDERELMVQNLESSVEEKEDMSVNVDKFMTWEQVSHMATEGIDFGSHTIHHRILTQLDQHGVKSEVSDSKKIIEEKLLKSIDDFSYPNGDFNFQIKEIVRESGYRMAFTTVPGRVDSNCDLFEIKRINIHEDMTRHMPMFYCRILGLF